MCKFLFLPNGTTPRITDNRRQGIVIAGLNKVELLNPPVHGYEAKEREGRTKGKQFTAPSGRADKIFQRTLYVISCPGESY
jgi:hypothetical protein